MTTMTTVPLGDTGETVSQLGLGCMLMGTQTNETDSISMIEQYLDAGGTFLDTANCYAWWTSPDSRGGDSESLLGRWFARTGRRDEVFLATKGTAMPRDLDALWAGRDEPDWDRAFATFDGAAADVLRHSVDDSLRRLQTDHIDLYYVHVDDQSTPLEETLAALADIVRAGKIRHIGWSNVRTWRLERIRQLCARHGWPAPVALQQQHSYLRQRPGQDSTSIVGGEQLDYLRAHRDLTLVAYSPILKGVYDDPAKRRGHHVMAPYEGADAEARIAELTKVADEIGAAPNQVVLAWLMRQTAPPMATLIGPRTLQQYEAGMAALGVRLSDDHVARLDGAGD